MEKREVKGIKDMKKKLDRVKEEMNKTIVGQGEVIDKLLIVLISKGHVLLEGVPGLAKTLMIHTLAQTLNCTFKRIQFTPDLLPADIVGTKIYDDKTKKFYTEKGPIFHNFILADEINRAPPKVQSALLESMQERQVTIQGDTYALPSPFFVMATQNPIENEGTYPLPEAQLDRFAFKVLVFYPTKDEEKEIMKRYSSNYTTQIKKVMGVEDIINAQKMARGIYLDESLQDYIVNIVDTTRNPQEYDDEIKEFIEYGSSPRATIWLAISSKARALLEGRDYVKPKDVKSIAKEVLRHRIILNYEAEAEGVTTDYIIDKILNMTTPP